MGEETTATTDATAASNAAPGAADTNQPAAAGGQQQTDASTEGKQPEGGEAAKTEEQGDDSSKAKDGDEGAPEAYEDFTMPEGVELDAELSDELKGLAKELGLPQARAQQLADLGAKMAQKWATGLQKAIAEQRADWQTQTKADKEIGGEKLTESLALSKRAAETFGGNELIELLNETGMGDHPVVVKAFFKIGQAISEDKLVPGGRPAKANDALAKLYPSMQSS